MNRSFAALLFVIVALVNASSTLGATILYVDDDAPAGGNGQSWRSAFRFLQDALTAASVPGSGIEEIRIAQGTYKPDRSETQPSGTGDKNAAFKLLSGKALVGGYAGIGDDDPDAHAPSLYVTTLSGDLAGNDQPGFVNYSDNSFHVVEAVALPSGPTIAGLEIRSGNAVGPNDNLRNGAGLFADGCKITISQCRFVHNRAAVRGGGMYFQGTGATTPLSVSQTAFADNRANVPTFSGFGGAAWIGGVSTFSNCIFESNNARLFGGAVDNGGTSTTTFNDCQFISNTCPDGGAIRFLAITTRTLNRCIFRNNVAQRGGAIFISSAPVVAVDCRFHQNKALLTTGGFAAGGAIYMEQTTIGGNSHLHATGCRFVGNQTSGRGGAIHGQFSAGLDHQLHLRGCMLVGNASGDEGGAVYASNFGGGAFQIQVKNCTVASNAASNDPGGGLVFTTTGISVLIQNSILWNNAAASGDLQNQQLSWPNDAAQQILFSCVQGCDGSLNGSNNIGDDPLFQDIAGADAMPGTVDDNLRLTTGSPCVDHGSNAAVPSGLTLDLDGSPRIVDGDGDGSQIVDMGAYELQRSKCVADIAPPEGDNQVNVDDLMLVINSWGSCATCPADLAPPDGDSFVDVDDLIQVILLWGPCKR